MDPRFERLSLARVRVMALLAANYTTSEIAAELGCSYHGARSKVRDVESLIGLPDSRAVGRWWQEHGIAWLRHAATAAGAHFGHPTCHDCGHDETMIDSD